MVELAEDRTRENPAETSDRSMTWRILVQGEMSSDVIIVSGIDGQDPAQMRFAEDDDVIEALSADRADQPLRVVRSKY